MNNLNKKYNNSVGYKGETAVIYKLKRSGFELYKRNIKEIDSEIDVVAYKYNVYKKSLDIRIIEVKTRNRYEFNLSSFGIDKKWRRIRKHIFNIKEDIDRKFDILNYSEIHFDLALVKYDDNDYKIYRYIKDVNLML